jgi:hypothetical protein
MGGVVDFWCGLLLEGCLSFAVFFKNEELTISN